jgi:hypothetical protein
MNRSHARLGRWWLRAGSTVLFVLTAGPSVFAVEALRPSLTEMSTEIARLLKGKNEDSIAVGAFTGPARAASSSGPAIKQILIEELRKQGIRVQSQASLEVNGDYRDVLDKDSQLLGLRIKASILDRQGEIVVVLDKKIDDRNVLAQMLGVTKTDFGAGVTAVQESRLIRERLEKPSVALVGTTVQPARKSVYAVEILVSNRGRFVTRQPFEEQGFAFVPIQRGEAFAVNLINNSDLAAAVELTLDGLSMFAFSQTQKYRHIIVPKRSRSLVKGWFRNTQLSDEFLITEYSKSASAELAANPEQIGTITATFAAAWDPRESPPADESSNFRDPFNTAVGRGRPVVSPFREVALQFGRVREIINVRYKRPNS